MIRIEGTDWEILRILKILPTRNIFLSEQIGVTPGKISHSISALEMMGLVKRNGKLLELTKQGVWYAEFYNRVRKK